MTSFPGKENSAFRMWLQEEVNTSFVTKDWSLTLFPWKKEFS